MSRPRQRDIKHRALAMCRCRCRCHADRQRHPQTSRNGDIKQSPRPAGSQADLASAAEPCEAVRVTSASWIGVERHQIHLPLLRWTEPARCHHRVSIGPIQVGFSLPHESHCDSEINKSSPVDQHLGNRFASCHREAKARHGDVIRPRVAATLSK